MDMQMCRRTFVGSAAAATAAVAAAGLGATGAVAAEAAGEVPAWLGLPPEIDESQIVETIDVDVLVCGIGTTGNFAIPAAAELGARVLGISPAPTPIYGVAGINSRCMIEAGGEWDDATKNDFLNEFLRYADGNVNPRLIKMFIENSGETMNWYADRLAEGGINLYWKNIAKPDDRYKGWAIAHDFPKDGPDFDPSVTQAILQEYGRSCGAEYRFGVSLVKLLTDEIGVCGAIAQNDQTGEYIRINTTGGVVLATGGYHANDDMMRALQPWSLNDYCCSNGILLAQGQGVKAALWAGAALDEHQCSMIFDRGALEADDCAGDLRKKPGSFFQLGSQPFLKVNLLGQRFTNESAPYDYILHASDAFPGKCYCTIWDANWYQHGEQFQTIGCSRFVPDQYSGNEGVMGLINMQLADLEERGFIVRADTIRELGEKLGIADPDVFVATVERYNELCALGEDPDFGKEGYRMVALDTPPFFGVRQSGCIGVTLSGVAIDEDTRVLDAYHNPIPGLYAAGSDSGGFFAHTYYNLTDSASGGRCSTTGRHAGQLAATQSREEVAAMRIDIYA